MLDNEGYTSQEGEQSIATFHFYFFLFTNFLLVAYSSNNNHYKKQGASIKNDVVITIMYKNKVDCLWKFMYEKQVAKLCT